MNKRAITSSFKKYLKDQGIKEKDISLKTLPDLFLAFYLDVPFETIDKEEDGDMLLFEYGTFNWGQGANFQIGLTRQLIGMHDDEEEAEDYMYQLQVTLFYNPSEFESLPAFNKWSNEFSDLNDFKNMIVNSAGYQVALSKKAIRLEIMTDKI
jgi:hypothetical protein